MQGRRPLFLAESYCSTGYFLATAVKRYAWVSAWIIREAAVGVAIAAAIGGGLYLVATFLFITLSWVSYGIGLFLGMMAALFGLVGFASEWLSDNLPIIGDILGLILIVGMLAPLIEEHGVIGALFFVFIVLPLSVLLAFWMAGTFQWLSGNVDMRAIVFGTLSVVLLSLTIRSSLYRPSDRLATRMKARELRGLHVASAAHAACARLASREFRDSLICFALALLSFATCVWRWSLVDANLFTSGSALNPAYFTFKLTGYAVRLLGDDPRAGINPDAKLFLFYVYAFYWYTILGGAALLKKALLDTMTATWRSVKSAVAEAERPACAPAA